MKKEDDNFQAKARPTLFNQVQGESTPLIWEKVRRQVQCFGGITATIDRKPPGEGHGCHGELSPPFTGLVGKRRSSILPLELLEGERLADGVDPIVRRLVENSGYKVIKNLAK